MSCQIFLKGDIPHPSLLNIPSTLYFICSKQVIDSWGGTTHRRAKVKAHNTARSYAIRSVERNTSYIVMIIEARNIIFRIFLWHVLKIAGFICIPRRTNILSPFANPVYLVQFIRLQGSRLNFFKVLSPINVWRTFEFRDHRIKKNLLKIYRCTCDIMMKRNYWGWWYMYIVINNYLLKSRSMFISSTLIRTCLAETKKGYTSCTIISYWSLSSTLLR